jgi:putative ABC transport system permease protein
MMEIVGVAGQVRSRPDQTEAPVQVYAPMAQRPNDDMYVAVRAESGDASALAPGVRAAIARIDKAQLVNVQDVTTFADISWSATSRHRFRAVLVTTLAGLALVLAMVGVFGVLAYSVQQRVREIGVRRALGASTGDVVRLVVGGAGRLIAAGVAIGLALAATFGRVLATMLFGVEPLDAVTFAGVAAVLVLAAGIAVMAPAWRAVHVEPAIALRSE